MSKWKVRDTGKAVLNVQNIQMKYMMIRRILDDVRETNVRTFLEVTDIAKIVSKQIRFWILQMNSHSRTCKECEEKNVFDFTDENSCKRQ